MTKKPIHVKQHSLVGSLSSVVDTKAFKSVDDEKASMPIGLDQVPQHLQSLLNCASGSLTYDQIESLRLLLVEYQDVFLGTQMVNLVGQT